MISLSKKRKATTNVVLINIPISVNEFSSNQIANILTLDHLIQDLEKKCRIIETTDILEEDTFTDIDTLVYDLLESPLSENDSKYMNGPLSTNQNYFANFITPPTSTNTFYSSFSQRDFQSSWVLTGNKINCDLVRNCDFPATSFNDLRPIDFFYLLDNLLYESSTLAYLDLCINPVYCQLNTTFDHLTICSNGITFQTIAPIYKKTTKGNPGNFWSFRMNRPLQHCKIASSGLNYTMYGSKTIDTTQFNDYCSWEYRNATVPFHPTHFETIPPGVYLITGNLYVHYDGREIDTINDSSQDPLAYHNAENGEFDVLRHFNYWSTLYTNDLALAYPENYPHSEAFNQSLIPKKAEQVAYIDSIQYPGDNALLHYRKLTAYDWKNTTNTYEPQQAPPSLPLPSNLNSYKPTSKIEYFCQVSFDTLDTSSVWFSQQARSKPYFNIEPIYPFSTCIHPANNHALVKWDYMPYQLPYNYGTTGSPFWIQTNNTSNYHANHVRNANISRIWYRSSAVSKIKPLTVPIQTMIVSQDTTSLFPLIEVNWPLWIHGDLEDLISELYIDIIKIA